MANYFNEEEVKSALKEYFQQTEEWKKSVAGQKQQLYLWKNVSAVIRGVIMTHKLYRFPNFDYNDVFSIAIEAVWKSLDKFDFNYTNKKTNKNSLFNYISIIAKKSITFTTLVYNNKHRKYDFRETDYFELDNELVYYDKEISCKEEIFQMYKEYFERGFFYKKRMFKRYDEFLDIVKMLIEATYILNNDQINGRSRHLTAETLNVLGYEKSPALITKIRYVKEYIRLGRQLSNNV